MSKQGEFEALCRDAVRINTENLYTILKENSNTEIGRKYGFSSLRDVREYQQRVPLSEYSDYAADVERMVAGEENILTAYPLANFCHSSGTEGFSKFIPVTYRGMEQYSDYIEHFKKKTVLESGTGKRFCVNLFRTDLNRAKEANLISSEIYYHYLMENGFLDMETFAGGKETLFCTGCGEPLYVKAWVALLTEDIVIIESIFLYDQLLFFQYLEKNWREILSDIRRKNIPEEKKIPAGLIKVLLNMPFSEERLNEIEEQCTAGFDNIAPRLWRGLKVLSGISNKTFFVEDSALKRYCGNIPIHYFAYVASECHLGVAQEVGKCRYIMMPKSAFVEYLPYGEKYTGTEKTYLPHELKKGELYEVVITNFCGFYRYRLGDVVLIADFYHESPVVEFMFRKGLAVNIAGEKLSARQLEKAVMTVKSKGHIDISEYSIASLGGEVPGRYAAVFAVEKDGAGVRQTEKEIATMLDMLLQGYNVDYCDLRKLKYIGQPDVLLLNHDSFCEFMKEIGCDRGHTKPHHVLTLKFPKEVWEQWKTRQ
jgi:hypothetical protein